MRVEFFPPVSLTEPRYWVRHEEGLAMMLGPGFLHGFFPFPICIQTSTEPPSTTTVWPVLYSSCMRKR